MRKERLYYVDGYHGGVRGHMPLGCWRDILETLKTNPDWKLCIDVEPISWEELQARDPAAYEELRELLKDTSVSARLEMVSGSYGQPYGWITDGESNIRHLTMGLEVMKKHFPWLRVTTYATQEPCWTSALPQILRSLHFDYAVLKDPSTAWGGYSNGRDAEVCFWEGPDGSRIPVVPRYACEKLAKNWETESVDGTEAFMLKCMEHGIPHPAGMIFQDLGWPSWPRLGGAPGVGEAVVPEHIVHATWKEYLSSIAEMPVEEPDNIWRVTQEDFLGALPWGERLLVRMARQVRRGERMLLECERLHALGSVLSGTVSDQERLKEAWGHLLMTQHHDGWICASTGKNEENWAWKTSAQIYAANSLTAPVHRNALQQIGRVVCSDEKDEKEKSGAETACVVNLLGRREERTVSLPITSPHGTQSFRVWDGDRLLSSQYMAERRFADGTKNAGTLMFRAALPAFGVKSFRMEPVETEESGCMAWVDGAFAYLETDVYAIRFDLEHGGTIDSLVDKRRQVELVDRKNERKFNEYSGFFIRENRFLSSAGQRAEAVVKAEGPVCAELEIQGTVGPVPFTQTVRVLAKESAIRIQAVFHFLEKTYIGDPHEMTPENDVQDGHRSYHDGRYKLNAWFPTAFEQAHLDKDAAYDVCRSREENTYFSTWNAIKHNILLNWVDVTDGAQGLAVVADHTTSYTHGKDAPLGLTMAWGWDAGYWWGRRQLKGDHTLNYAIVPHTGDWRKGDVWHECQKLLQEPVVQRMAAASARQCRELIAVEAPVELSAVCLDDQGRVLARLFNPGPGTQTEITLDAEMFSIAELVELDGTLIGNVPLSVQGDRLTARLELPSFAIRTLRLTPVPKRQL